MIDSNMEVAVNVAKAPIDFGLDIVGKVRGSVVKKQHVREQSDLDILSAADQDDEIKEEQEQELDEDSLTGLLSDHEYSSNTVRRIEQSIPSMDRHDHAAQPAQGAAQRADSDAAHEPPLRRHGRQGDGDPRHPIRIQVCNVYSSYYRYTCT